MALQLRAGGLEGPCHAGFRCARLPDGANAPLIDFRRLDAIARFYSVMETEIADSSPCGVESAGGPRSPIFAGSHSYFTAIMGPRLATVIRRIDASKRPCDAPSACRAGADGKRRRSGAWLTTDSNCRARADRGGARIGFHYVAAGDYAELLTLERASHDILAQEIHQGRRRRNRHRIWPDRRRYRRCADHRGTSTACGWRRSTPVPASVQTQLK